MVCFARFIYPYMQIAVDPQWLAPWTSLLSAPLALAIGVGLVAYLGVQWEEGPALLGLLLMVLGTLSFYNRIDVTDTVKMFNVSNSLSYTLILFGLISFTMGLPESKNCPSKQ